MGSHFISHALLHVPGTITKGNKVPMYVLAVEYQRSSDFSSNTYKDLKVGLDSAPEAFAKAKASGASLLLPGGTHDLWMRYWLAGGINPEQDLSDWCRHRRWYKT